MKSSSKDSFNFYLFIIIAAASILRIIAKYVIFQKMNVGLQLKSREYQINH